MGRLLVCLLLLSVAVGLLPANAGDKAKDEKELFSGKDLKGWKFRGGDAAAPKSKWSVVESISLDKDPTRLVGKAGMGVLLNGHDGHGVGPARRADDAASDGQRRAADAATNLRHGTSSGGEEVPAGVVGDQPIRVTA